MNSLVDKLFELGKQLASGADWWVYLLIALAPICMLLAFREGMCWFWKVNTLVNRLDRIEKRLAKLDTSPPPSPKQKIPSRKKRVASDDEYTLS